MAEIVKIKIRILNDYYSDFPFEELIIELEKGLDYFGRVSFSEYMRGTDMLAHSGEYSFGDINYRHGKEGGHCCKAFMALSQVFENDEKELSQETKKARFDIEAIYDDESTKRKYFVGTFKENNLGEAQHYLKKAMNITKVIEVFD